MISGSDCTIAGMKWLNTALPNIARRVTRDVVDLLLPVNCPVCETRVADGGGLCASCWQGLDVVSRPVCDVYGAPMTFDAGEGAVSARAISEPPKWNRARGAVLFNERSQHLVHSLKYRDRHEVVSSMAAMMVHAGRDILGDADIIVPVPLHRWRLWSRRYNQSALLANEIARSIDVACEPALVSRLRNTRSQVGLDGKQRGRNVKGAFAVEDALVPLVLGRRVVLVDDVMTSGSTASECANAIAEAGASNVDVLVFALVSHEN